MRSKRTGGNTRLSRAKAMAARRAQSRAKVATYRARMRKRGLKPVQLWLPDVNSPEFIAEANRQARLIANSPYEADDQGFIDAIAAGLEDGNE